MLGDRSLCGSNWLQKNKTRCRLRPSTCVLCWFWRTPVGLCLRGGIHSGCGSPWQPPHSWTWWQSRSLCTYWCWNLWSLSHWRRHQMVQRAATRWPRQPLGPGYKWRCTNHWGSSPRLHHCSRGPRSWEKTWRQRTGNSSQSVKLTFLFEPFKSQHQPQPKKSSLTTNFHSEIFQHFYSSRGVLSLERPL